MELNENQKKAVEYLGGPLLVVAGPGTGKTQLLSKKVVYILENTDTNPENILCLTFTDTGAKNMRERLKSIIGKDALKVNIGTYHAFGQEILAQYKNYTADYDRRLDAAIDEVTQYKIVKELQSALPGNDILRGDAVRDIIEVISSAKSARLTAEDLLAIAKQNMEDSEVLSRTISPYLLEVVPRKFKESLDRAYGPIYEILKNYDNEIIIKNVERTISGLARTMKEAMAEAEGTESVAPLTKWRNDNFEKDAKGNYRLKDTVANKKLLSVAKLMGQYEEYLRENGLFDFDDMIEEAVKALTTDAGFKMTLQEKYQYIMLDEFQDTNPSQFAIVKELTDYEKPMVMAVGDDDQAIYEFQGALSSNLMDFQKHYSAEMVALVENYRSTQEILDFSKQMIDQVPASERVMDKALVAHKPKPAKSQIYRYEFNSSDAEFGFVASEIARLINSGVPQGQIAVISYKTKYFEPLLPFLKAHEEIKIAYEKRDNLLDDEKMHMVLTICRYIHEKAIKGKSSVQLMEILAYDCFGLSVLEVVKLVTAARQVHADVAEYVTENGSEAVREVMGWLAELTARSLTEPLVAILYKVAQRMKIDEMSEYARFRFYENLAVLKGKLTRHFGEKALKVADLIAMLDDYEAAEMPLTVTSPYRDSEEAVQILSAHKAKGLEFEYVFILSADHTAWGKGKGNNNLLALPKNLVQIRHTGVTDGERLRVLYVALTRAKSHLYITNSLTDFDGKSPERLEYFEEHVVKNADGEEEVISPFLPDKKVRLMYGSGDYVKCVENVRNWFCAYLAESPDMREFYKARMAGFKMSPSALTSFLDIIYGGPQSFFERYVLNAPSEPDTLALVLGNLMHATFEQVTKEGLSDAEAIEFYKAEAAKYDTTEENRRAALERGVESLELALVKFGEIVRQGQAEVNFRGESLAMDGVLVTGKIDHIVIDEANKTIEVYDYKTGTYNDGKWESQPGPYWYMMQLWFYKMLLGLSAKYRGYKVTRGHILYVIKDHKFGEVYDKVLNFDEVDDGEMLRILKAVYRQATSLAFLDDPELFVAADKSRSMKQIREFIALLLAKSA